MSTFNDLIKEYDEYALKHSSSDTITKLMNKLVTTNYKETVGVPFYIANVDLFIYGGGQFEIYELNSKKPLYKIYCGSDYLVVTIL